MEAYLNRLYQPELRLFIMQEKELFQTHSVFNTDKIQKEKTNNYPTIIEIRDAPQHNALIRDYNLYKNSQIRRCFLAQVITKLSGFCKFTFELCNEIWKEIMPQNLRGNIQMDINSNKVSDQSKERKFFEEFKKKRTRFFVIVFDDQSTEDEMQQAFQKASFITPQGRGITIEQLVKQTCCATWQIKSWSRTKRYSILFFKFDLFQHLLFFGNLTKQMIDNNKQVESYFQNFKTELNNVYDQYENIEREFVGSYMEKEDRIELSLE